MLQSDNAIPLDAACRNRSAATRARITFAVLILVVIAAIATWQGSVARTRNALLRNLLSRTLITATTEHESAGPTTRLGLVRGLLGDEPIRIIHYSADLSPSEMAELDRAFPEATLIYAAELPPSP